MTNELHRYLDGEIERSQLSAEGLAQLREWESMKPMFGAKRSMTAPRSLADNVMRALPPLHVPAWRRAIDWLVTPRPIRIAPAFPMALAGALAIVLMVVRRPEAQPSPNVAEMTSHTTAVANVVNAQPVYVQFTMRTKNATSVSVAGDFNGWKADSVALRDPDGDGVWTGLVALQPGIHKYMFVVDGKWITDPAAESYVDDGFGMRNAVIGVQTPRVI